MELDPQTQQYEHPYQQPVAKEANTSQAYMDLNPQTRENTSAYQELHRNAKSPQGAESEAYEDINDIKEVEPKHHQVHQEIADNKEESQEYVNIKQKKPGPAKRK